MDEYEYNDKPIPRVYYYGAWAAFIVGLVIMEPALTGAAIGFAAGTQVGNGNVTSL